MKSAAAKNTLILVAIAFVAITLDQVSKLLVVGYLEPGRSLTIIPHVLWITHLTNPGAAFGILKGSSQIVFLSALLLVIVTLALFYRSKFRKSYWSFAGMGMIVGGAIGNLSDRVIRGNVIDFVDLGWWPVFNLADMFIVAGVIMLVVSTFIDLRRENKDHGEARR